MLFAIGGALDHHGDKVILKKLLSEARGSASSICVITSATAFPDKAREAYQDVFAGLGIKDCRILHIEHVDEGEKPDNIQIVKNADIVFFSGGNQIKLAQALQGSSLMKAIFDRLQNGGIVAGTSAGAAAMSKLMIYGEQRRENGKHRGNSVSLKEGFGLTPHLIIDTHFSERKRLSRLFGTLSKNPAHIGLGLDENTAAMLRPDGTLEVIGTGTVTIVQGAQAQRLPAGKKDAA